MLGRMKQCLSDDAFLPQIVLRMPVSLIPDLVHIVPVCTLTDLEPVDNEIDS